MCVTSAGPSPRCCCPVPIRQAKRTRASHTKTTKIITNGNTSRRTAVAVRVAPESVDLLLGLLQRRLQREVFHLHSPNVEGVEGGREGGREWMVAEWDGGS